MTDHPQLAVSAALFRGNDVLLVKRSEGQSLAGLLSLPGGRVGFGESLIEAVTREIEEEVGVTVDPASLRFMTNHEAIHADFHFVICVFAGQITPDTCAVAGSDAAGVEFVDVEMIETLERNGQTTPDLARIIALAKTTVR